MGNNSFSEADFPGKRWLFSESSPRLHSLPRAGVPVPGSCGVRAGGRGELLLASPAAFPPRAGRGLFCKHRALLPSFSSRWWQKPRCLCLGRWEERRL